MKKILIVLLAAVLLCADGVALEGRGYPNWAGGDAPAGTLCGAFDGENLRLAFDPSADFSMTVDGYLQACFYAMSAVGDNYIEIYLILPQNAQAGDVISPDFAAASGLDRCGIDFYEVARGGEDYYVAMQSDGAAYPEISSYELRVESFAETETAYAVRGTLTAVLAQMKELAPTGRTMNLTGVTFDFTLPKANVGTAEPTIEPTGEPSAENPFAGDTPEPKSDFFAGEAEGTPAPMFTLPPNYARI